MSIEETRHRYEDQLLRLPNVTGVGIGQKEGKPVIKVFVTRKVPASELQPQELVPKTLEGHPTDVEEAGVIQAQ